MKPLTRPCCKLRQLIPLETTALDTLLNNDNDRRLAAVVSLPNLQLRTLLSALLLLILSLPVLADIEGKVEFLEDQSRELSISRLASDWVTMPRGDWLEIDTDIPAFGFSRSAFWVTVELAPRLPAEQILSINYPTLNSIEVHLFRQDDEGLVPVYSRSTGSLLPYSARPMPVRSFAFPLQLGGADSYRLFVRIQGEASLLLPWSLDSGARYVRNSEFQSLLLGIGLGILVAMLLYHLFLFAATRGRSQFDYCVFVAANVLLLLSHEGLLFQLLLQNHPAVNAASMAILINVTTLSGWQFVYRLLGLSKRSTMVGLIFRVVMLLAFAALVLSIVIPSQIVQLLSIAIAAVTVVLLWCIAVREGLRGSMPAKLLALSWTAYVAGAVAASLSRTGLIPVSNLTENALLLGICAEVIVASLAIAANINYTKDQLLATQRKQTLQERELRVAQEQISSSAREASDRLENEVARRTLELRSATGKLEIANEQLKAISRIDALTGLQNRRYLTELLNQVVASLKRAGHDSDQPSTRWISLVLGDIDHFKSINDNYGHQAGDSCLGLVAQALQKAVHRPEDHIIRYGGEEFLIVLLDTGIVDARAVAERARKEVAAVQTGNLIGSRQLSMSFGVISVELRSDSDEVQQTLHESIVAADRRLYIAKSEGRNRVVASG